MTGKRPSVSHAAVVARLLKSRPALGRQLVRVALEEAADPTGRLVLLRVLRRVTRAQGVGAVAERAGMKVQSLSRSLSDRGNPTLSTLAAITASMGMTITVTESVSKKTARPRPVIPSRVPKSQPATPRAGGTAASRG